jgi:hypothetical protein
MTTRRSVVVVTGTREEYELGQATMGLIERDPDLSLSTVVTGMHLSPKHGYTVNDIRNDGSLFIGEHSPGVFGDKAVGTNHSLPTLEVSRYSGGIWVGTYLKTLTHQEATAEGAAEVAEWAARICELEGTHGHQLSAEARIRDE